uniref:Uncharacterized protein n=1 Tax=Arundo donax TaxID=35708 RepID=A0A0A9ALN8_ARUDO
MGSAFTIDPSTKLSPNSGMVTGNLKRLEPNKTQGAKHNGKLKLTILVRKEHLSTDFRQISKQFSTNMKPYATGVLKY